MTVSLFGTVVYKDLKKGNTECQNSYSNLTQTYELVGWLLRVLCRRQGDTLWHMYRAKEELKFWGTSKLDQWHESF